MNNIKRIIFHYESTKDHAHIINLIRKHGKDPVVAINIETDYYIMEQFFFHQI